MSFLTNSTWVKSKVLSSVQQALDTYVDFDSISASDYSFQMSNWCTEAHIELEPPGGMRLRAAALEDLGAAHRLTPTGGRIRRLRLSVPFTQLATKSVEVEVDGVELALTINYTTPEQRAQDVRDAATMVQAALQRKEAELEAAELELRAASLAHGGTGKESWTTLRQVLERIRVSVTDVHVRFEDRHLSPPVVIGLRLASLTVRSTNAEWMEQHEDAPPPPQQPATPPDAADTARPLRYKLLQVTGLEVYCYNPPAAHEAPPEASQAQVQGTTGGDQSAIDQEPEPEPEPELEPEPASEPEPDPEPWPEPEPEPEQLPIDSDSSRDERSLRKLERRHCIVSKTSARLEVTLGFPPSHPSIKLTGRVNKLGIRLTRQQYRSLMRVKEVRDDLEWRSLEHAYSPQQAEIAREDAAVVQRLRSDEELAWMVPNEQDDDAETVVSAQKRCEALYRELLAVSPQSALSPSQQQQRGLIEWRLPTRTVLALRGVEAATGLTSETDTVFDSLLRLLDCQYSPLAAGVAAGSPASGVMPAEYVSVAAELCVDNVHWALGVGGESSAAAETPTGSSPGSPNTSTSSGSSSHTNLVKGFFGGSVQMQRKSMIISQITESDLTPRQRSQHGRSNSTSGRSCREPPCLTDVGPAQKAELLTRLSQAARHHGGLSREARDDVALRFDLTPEQVEQVVTWAEGSPHGGGLASPGTVCGPVATRQVRPKSLPQYAVPDVDSDNSYEDDDEDGNGVDGGDGDFLRWRAHAGQASPGGSVRLLCDVLDHASGEVLATEQLISTSMMRSSWCTELQIDIHRFDVCDCDPETSWRYRTLLGVVNSATTAADALAQDDNSDGFDTADESETRDLPPPIIALTVQYTPSSELTNVVRVLMRPVQVVYSPTVVFSLVHLFDIAIDNWERTQENLSRNISRAMSANRWELYADIDAPIFIAPVNPRDDNSAAAVVDLGHMDVVVLHGGNAMCLVDVDTAGFIQPTKSAPASASAKGASATDLPDEEPESFADHVQVHMTGMQLLMAQPTLADEDVPWVSMIARTKPDDAARMIQKCSVNLAFWSNPLQSQSSASHAHVMVGAVKVSATPEQLVKLQDLQMSIRIQRLDAAMQHAEAFLTEKPAAGESSRPYDELSKARYLVERFPILRRVDLERVYRDCGLTPGKRVREMWLDCFSTAHTTTVDTQESMNEGDESFEKGSRELSVRLSSASAGLFNLTVCCSNMACCLHDPGRSELKCWASIEDIRVAVNLDADNERQKAFLGIRKLSVQAEIDGHADIFNLVRTSLANDDASFSPHLATTHARSTASDDAKQPLNDLLQVRYSHLTESLQSCDFGQMSEADHSLSVEVASIVIAWHPQVTTELVDTLTTLRSIASASPRAADSAVDLQPEPELGPEVVDEGDAEPPLSKDTTAENPDLSPPISGDTTVSVEWDALPVKSPVPKRGMRFQQPRGLFKIRMLFHGVEATLYTTFGFSAFGMSFTGLEFDHLFVHSAEHSTECVLNSVAISDMRPDALYPSLFGLRDESAPSLVTVVVQVGDCWGNDGRHMAGHEEQLKEDTQQAQLRVGMDVSSVKLVWCDALLDDLTAYIEEGRDALMTAYSQHAAYAPSADAHGSEAPPTGGETTSLLAFEACITISDPLLVMPLFANDGEFHGDAELASRSGEVTATGRAQYVADASSVLERLRVAEKMRADVELMAPRLRVPPSKLSLHNDREVLITANSLRLQNRTLDEPLRLVQRVAVDSLRISADTKLDAPGLAIDVQELTLENLVMKKGAQQTHALPTEATWSAADVMIHSRFQGSIEATCAPVVGTYWAAGLQDRRNMSTWLRLDSLGISLCNSTNHVAFSSKKLLVDIDMGACEAIVALCRDPTLPIDRGGGQDQQQKWMKVRNATDQALTILLHTPASNGHQSDDESEYQPLATLPARLPSDTLAAREDDLPSVPIPCPTNGSGDTQRLCIQIGKGEPSLPFLVTKGVPVHEGLLIELQLSRYVRVSISDSCVTIHPAFCVRNHLPEDVLLELSNAEGMHPPMHIEGGACQDIYCSRFGGSSITQLQAMQVTFQELQCSFTLPCTQCGGIGHNRRTCPTLRTPLPPPGPPGMESGLTLRESETQVTLLHEQGSGEIQMQVTFEFLGPFELVIFSQCWLVNRTGSALRLRCPGRWNDVPWPPTTTKTCGRFLSQTLNPKARDCVLSVATDGATQLVLERPGVGSAIELDISRLRQFEPEHSGLSIAIESGCSPFGKTKLVFVDLARSPRIPVRDPRKDKEALLKDRGKDVTASGRQHWALSFFFTTMKMSFADMASADGLTSQSTGVATPLFPAQKALLRGPLLALTLDDVDLSVSCTVTLDETMSRFVSSTTLADWSAHHATGGQRQAEPTLAKVKQMDVHVALGNGTRLQIWDVAAPTTSDGSTDEDLHSAEVDTQLLDVAKVVVQASFSQRWLLVDTTTDADGPLSPRSRLEELSVEGLRDLIGQAGVACEHCADSKSDLRDLAKSALASVACATKGVPAIKAHVLLGQVQGTIDDINLLRMVAVHENFMRCYNQGSPLYGGTPQYNEPREWLEALRRSCANRGRSTAPFPERQFYLEELRLAGIDGTQLHINLDFERKTAWDLPKLHVLLGPLKQGQYPSKGWKQEPIVLTEFEGNTDTLLQRVQQAGMPNLFELLFKQILPRADQLLKLGVRHALKGWNSSAQLAVKAHDLGLPKFELVSGEMAARRMKALAESIPEGYSTHQRLQFERRLWQILWDWDSNHTGMQVQRRQIVLLSITRSSGHPLGELQVQKTEGDEVIVAAGGALIIGTGTMAVPGLPGASLLDSGKVKLTVTSQELGLAIAVDSHYLQVRGRASTRPGQRSTAYSVREESGRYWARFDIVVGDTANAPTAGGTIEGFGQPPPNGQGGAQLVRLPTSAPKGPAESLAAASSSSVSWSSSADASATTEEPAAAFVFPVVSHGSNAVQSAAAVAAGAATKLVERGKLARGATLDSEYVPGDLVTGTIASVTQALGNVSRGLLCSCVVPAQGRHGWDTSATATPRRAAAAAAATEGRYAPPTKLHWIFDDVRLPLLGHAAARANPLRWTSGTLHEVEAELSGRLMDERDAHRGVEMRFEGPSGEGEYAFANVAAAVGWVKAQIRLGRLSS